MHKIVLYCRLARLHHPAGWLLLLWATLWGLVVAAGESDAGNVPPKWYAVFIIGVIAMRSFGCIVNDWSDRELDAQVTRTKTRPLATGMVSAREAFACAAFFLAIAFALWLLLPLAAKLWSLIALALCIIYPFSKRFVKIPQLFLGLAFSSAIPIAYATLVGEVTWSAGLLVLSNLCWVLAYDTIYAMVDRADDLRIGNRSSAIFFGKHDVFAVSACYVVMLLALSSLGLYGNFGLGYQLFLLVGFGYVFTLYRRYRTRDPAACWQVFLDNHWLGAIVYLGLLFALFQ